MKKLITLLLFIFLIGCVGHQIQGTSTIYTGSYMTVRNIEAVVTVEVYSDGYIKGNIDSIGQGIEYDLYFQGPYSKQYHRVYYSEYNMSTFLNAEITKGNLDFYYFRLIENNIPKTPIIKLERK
jgi:hypothetical protein